jgi:Holliday junction resolvase RusA-like endonuclease
MLDKNRLKLKYSFFFGIAPHGKDRPRVGRNRKMYTPKATVDFEEAIAISALAQIKKLSDDAGPIEGPVAIEVVFAFEIPKSYTAKKRSDCSGQKILHTKTPDVDNCLKALKDAMNKIVYRDDSQVCYVEAAKIYAKSDPYIVVRVYEVL